MIIDSKQYNRPCTCGRTHQMVTEYCVIKADCMAEANGYIAQSGLHGFAVAIYDENTYRATAGKHPTADCEIILPPENLHADNHGVALAKAELPENADYLIAVGSGTVHDITRYCAYEMGIPFVSCPTAASVDGFCSSVAAMTWDGYKKTFTAVAPKLVIADSEILSRAPARLTNSGFGDMIGKFIALADWRIAHLLTGEYFCPVIHDMTMDATLAVSKNASAIQRGDPTAIEKLIYGLLMSGLAMQMLGNSRCASGAEHHISHLIEMQPEGLGAASAALHGEKVGVGTLQVCREYHRMRTDGIKPRNDYSAPDRAYIEAMFGDRLSAAIIKENERDCALTVSAASVTEHWNEICAVIDGIPTYDELMEKYQILGAKTTLSEIEIPEDKLDILLEYSPLVRNRLTLMRLRSGMKRG